MTTRSGARFRNNVVGFKNGQNELFFQVKKKRRYAKDDYAGRAEYNLPIDTFVRLTRTCQKAHSRCFKNLGHKITITEESVEVDQKNGQTEFRLCEAKVMQPSRLDYFMDDLEGHLETLRHLPCQVHLEIISTEMNEESPVTSELITEIRGFLSKFPVKRIKMVAMDQDELDWPSIIELLKEYHVTEFSSRSTFELSNGPYEFEEESKHEISDSQKEALLAINFTSFACSLSIPEDFVVSRWIPDLFSFGTKVSRETTKLIVNKFMSTNDLKCYKILGTLTKEEFKNLWLNNRTYPREYNRKVENERPLVFTDDFDRDEWNVECYRRTVLTEDSRVVAFEMMWNKDEGQDSDNCFMYFNHITDHFHWPTVILNHLGITFDYTKRRNMATPAFYSFF